MALAAARGRAAVSFPLPHFAPGAHFLEGRQQRLELLAGLGLALHNRLELRLRLHLAAHEFLLDAGEAIGVRLESLLDSLEADNGFAVLGLADVRRRWPGWRVAKRVGKYESLAFFVVVFVSHLPTPLAGNRDTSSCSTASNSNRARCAVFSMSRSSAIASQKRTPMSPEAVLGEPAACAGVGIGGLQSSATSVWAAIDVVHTVPPAEGAARRTLCPAGTT